MELKDRLSEVIERSGMRKAELVRRLNLNGHKFSPQALSNATKGKPISAKVLNGISDILNIHRGYLLLDDNGFTGSYDEYIDFKNLMGDPNFIKYQNLFSLAGVILTSKPNDEPPGDVIYNLGVKSLSFSDMERVYQIIIEKIKPIIKNTVKQYIDIEDFFNNLTQDDLHDESKWTEFFKWHQDFFEEHEGYDDLLKNKEIKKAWDLRK